MGSHVSEIKPLGEDSIRRIVAEQAVTDLSSIVKELVDNALDAESSTIKVRLFGQGLDIVEVSDDGSGVPLASRPFLATRYATSKINRFEDIYAGTGLTMGFRGEALFSMACLSQTLIVATRTEEDELAQKMEFGRDGSINLQSVESIHRKVGTTVAVVKPFLHLPARRADMARRIRTERAKLFRLLESYAIFNIGIQINLLDIGGSGREDVALATSATSTKLEETVSSVLGHKFLGPLAPIELGLESILKRTEECYEYNWGIKGLISKNPHGTAPGRTVNYYSINGRVVELPQVTKLLRKVWNGFGGKRKPSCVLCFTLPNDAFDINLSPDKQHVLFTQEQDICQLLQEHMRLFWVNQTSGVFQVQQLDLAPLDEADFPLEVGDDMEDGERQKHKRRFAFVHDLSKAKMQHDHAERETYKYSEEKKLDETNKQQQASSSPQQLQSSSKTTEEDEQRKASSPQQSSSCTTTEEVVEESPSKKAKVTLRSEETTDTSTTSPENNGSVDTPNTGRASRRSLRDNNNNDGVSDMERRQWTEIQSKFNRGERSTEKAGQQSQSHSVPVTPDDLPPHATMTTEKSQSSRMAQVPLLNTTTTRTSNQQTKTTNDNKKSTKTSPKSVCLKQFAFQSMNNESSNSASSSLQQFAHPSKNDESSSSASSCGRPRRARADTTKTTESASKSTRRGEVKVARKKVHDDNGESDPSDDDNGELDPSETHEKEAESLAQQSLLESERTLQGKNRTTPRGISSTPDEDESPSIDTSREEASSSTSPEPIVWKSFQGTEDSCRGTRMERFRMRRRKRNHDEIRNSNVGKKSSLDKDAEDVAKSVGSQETKDSVISLSKSEFRQDMQVIGQFNLGFMLVRCKKNHLWILDQHACDEKYNFEDLCRNTVLHEQKLLKPMLLDNLSPSEEACILDHMHIFEANGFRFDFKPEAPVRHRLFLTALPHSGAQAGRKAVQFGKDDVTALCSILSEGSSYDGGDGGTGTDGSGKYGNNAVRRYASIASTQDTSDRIVARLPKAIAMFASRACRTSIMIGTALSQKEMEKVVQRLADVEHPWNCPHGRPTMRHVGDILPVLLNDERKAVDHITGPTATVTPMTQEPSCTADE